MEPRPRIDLRIVVASDDPAELGWFVDPCRRRGVEVRFTALNAAEALVAAWKPHLVVLDLGAGNGRTHVARSTVQRVRCVAASPRPMLAGIAARALMDHAWLLDAGCFDMIVVRPCECLAQRDLGRTTAHRRATIEER